MPGMRWGYMSPKPQLPQEVSDTVTLPLETRKQPRAMQQLSQGHRASKE